MPPKKSTKQVKKEENSPSPTPNTEGPHHTEAPKETQKSIIKKLFMDFNFPPSTKKIIPFLLHNHNFGVFFTEDGTSLQLLNMKQNHNHKENDPEEGASPSPFREEKGNDETIQEQKPSAAEKEIKTANPENNEKNKNTFFSTDDLLVYINAQQKCLILRPTMTECIRDNISKSDLTRHQNKLVLLIPSALQKKVQALVRAVRQYHRGEETVSSDNNNNEVVEVMEDNLWFPTNPDEKNEYEVKKTSYGEYYFRNEETPNAVQSNKKRTKDEKEKESLNHQNKKDKFWCIPYLLQVSALKPASTTRKRGRPASSAKKATATSPDRSPSQAVLEVKLGNTIYPFGADEVCQ